jgi:DNA-directed RNA polymerase specialized sigma24 family protein
MWDAFVPWLLQVAARTLRGQLRCFADEEDVVVMAMNSFFRGVRRGRFPDLRDGAGLRRLLFQMTRRKAVDLIRFNERQKRSVKRESMPAGLEDSDGPTFDQLPSCHASPGGEGPHTRTCDEWLELLDPDLRELAVLKLQGYTNQEIARRIARSMATVERRFKLIRETWCLRGAYQDPIPPKNASAARR